MARRKQSPYRQSGTSHGDAVVGACDKCRRDLKRADAFVTLLSKQLLCLSCHESRESAA